MAERPLVRNAGSPRQVRRAARREAEIDERFLFSLERVLATKDGRAFVAGLLEEASVYRSVWREHGARMAWAVGQQDFGHFILAKCLEANEELTQTMEREARAWKRREDDKRAADDKTADAETENQE